MCKVSVNKKKINGGIYQKPRSPRKTDTRRKHKSTSFVEVEEDVCATKAKEPLVILNDLNQDLEELTDEHRHCNSSGAQNLSSVTTSSGIDNAEFKESMHLNGNFEWAIQQKACHNSNIHKCRYTAFWMLEFPTELHRENWLNNVKAFMTFKEEHGHSDVPSVYDKHNKLVKWVRSLRCQYHSIIYNPSNHQTSLTEQHILRLNEIGFSWDPNKKSFFHWYQKLLQYKEKNGNAHVLDECIEFGGIGMWTKQIRNDYKKIRTHKHSRYVLANERVQMLEELGFQWSISEAKWMRKYEKLVNFRKLFGTCFVSKKYDYHLYNFVNIQRRDYRIRFNKSITKKWRGISDKRIRLLKQVDFVFEVKGET